MKSGIAFGSISLLAFVFTLPIINKTAAPKASTPISAPRLETNNTPQKAENAGIQSEKDQTDTQVVTLPTADTKPKFSGNQLYDLALRSTVWVNNYAESGAGTGTLINAVDRLVLTNYHVVFKKMPVDFSKCLVPRRKFQDQLNYLGSRDPLTKFPCKFFDFDFAYGKFYLIEMQSYDFESYLGIFNDRGNFLVGQRGNGQKNTTKLLFIAPTGGRHYIMATSFAGGIGGFSLSISEIDLRRIPPAAAAVAPFVQVDFPVHKDGSLVANRESYRTGGESFRLSYTAKVIAWCEARDLAVLQLDSLPAKAIPMALSKRSSQPGEMVHSIGNPGGSGALWVYTSGTVRTAPYKSKWESSDSTGIRMKHDAWIIETQSAINPGDSGGPLVNENGELVAVTQGNKTVSNSISLFIDVREVREFLRSNGLRWVQRKN